MNPTLINPPDLRYILCDVEVQLRSHPTLDLPANIEPNIWSYYKLLKIQASVLSDTLFVTLTIPLVDKNVTSCLYKIQNLLLLHPVFQKSFCYELTFTYFAIRSDSRYMTLTEDNYGLIHIVSTCHFCRLNTAEYPVDRPHNDSFFSVWKQ